MGVAARVAEERGEEVGKCIGYSIRLETKAGSRNLKPVFKVPGSSASN